MAGFLRTPLLLLSALALAMCPTASTNPDKPPLLGGLKDADLNENSVQQALNLALNEYKVSKEAFHNHIKWIV